MVRQGWGRCVTCDHKCEQVWGLSLHWRGTDLLHPDLMRPLAACQRGAGALHPPPSCSTSSPSSFCTSHPAASFLPSSRRSHTSRQRPVCIGSSSNSQSVRFRLEYTPPSDDDGTGPSFHGRAESLELHDPESDVGAFNPADPGSRQQRLTRRPGQIRVPNAHAQRAFLTPFRMPHQKPLSNEEYFIADLERDYNKDFPHVVQTPDGKAVFKPGFLQLIDDPDVPYYFVYSGVERFIYSLPERAMQSAATALGIAAAAAAFAALAAWHPELALAALASWLRNSLSLVRCAVLLALAAYDKMWLFWAALAGKLIDGVLERHAPPLRDTMWWLFKLWLGWNLLTTALTPPLPIGPFAPFAGGAFSYPFPIFRM